MTGLQQAQNSPCYTSLCLLHWLPVAARIKFKTLMPAYRTASAPSYLHSLITIHIPSRSLKSAGERRLMVPSERHKITLQNVFIHRSWLVELNSHPHPECWIPDNLQATPENSSLQSSLDFILKKIKNLHSLSLTLISFP